MSSATWALLALASTGWVATLAGSLALWRALRKKVVAPSHWPSISVLKPLAGTDDELPQNLESYLAIDYPGNWELLLGVRDMRDPAYPIALAFARAHPERCRLLLQQGEPGFNPKVNQLITLTRESRGEIVAVSDSNVRVPPSYLREVAAVLDRPGVGIATHLIAGVGEKRLGAMLDNLTLALFVTPNLALATTLGRDEVVGKSMAMRRELLAQTGGWERVKDILAEDQQLGAAFRDRGLHSAFCPTPVQNVQVNQPVSAFFRRQSRWLMIRYRISFPWVLLEPALLLSVLPLFAALLSPASWVAWVACGASLMGTIALAQWHGRLLRGHGFSALALATLLPRELLFLAAWAYASTVRGVEWRGTRLRVGNGTRLIEEGPARSERPAPLP